LVLVDTLDLHATREALSLLAGVSCDINKGMHRERQNSLLHKSSLVKVQHMQLHGLQEANRVTETTNMGQSNGTNLKPVPPIYIYFFNKLMKIRKY